MRAIVGERRIPSKVWAIQIGLHDCDQSPVIMAVDTNTKKFICYLIKFNDDGSIVSCAVARSALYEKGYDPDIYMNKWDRESDSLIFDNDRKDNYNVEFMTKVS